MKIVSFNTQHCLNYVTKKIDFDIMARTIRELDADIVGLNEMRGPGTDADYTAQVEKLAGLTGMKYFYFAPAIEISGKGPYGNGLLSRLPILRAETVSIPDPEPRKYNGYYETRCILKAELERGITVLVTHFGLNPDEQENAVNTVINSLTEQKCILMGDFNLTPNSAIIHPIRKRMSDAADMVNGEGLSYPSDTPDRKIDYIFVSPDITVTEASVPPMVASDHRPHVATVRL